MNSIEKFLMERAIPIPESGCWLWEKGTTGPGYGALYINGKQVLAHRYAYELANGPIPPGMLVCHQCDVRSCVNPAHLWIGGHKENLADMREKGRGRGGFPVGYQPPITKLTWGTVHQIRLDRMVGDNLTCLASRYEVSISTIHAIVTGKTWKEN